MDDLICLQDVDVNLRDGARALRGVTLRIRSGETAAFLGGPAQAREALMGVVAGMAPARAGVVRVAGYELSTLSPEAAADFRAAHIGYVPAEPYFLQGLTALENAALPLSVRGIGRATREKAAMELLEKTGLRPMAFARPARLTRQERLRLALARALAAQPDILLLDDLAAGAMAAELARLRSILEQHRVGRTILQFAQDDAVLAPDRTFRIIHAEMREDPR